jgi:hypothetical protein
MTKLTIISIAGVALLLMFVLSFATLGLAVREGVIDEQEHWLPSRTGRYQVIVRVGSDALPWDRRGNRPMAINVWLHGRGTDWHVIPVLHVPLGEKAQAEGVPR